MTDWKDDEEQVAFLNEWIKTHRRWTVKIYNLTPAWEECREYHKIRYFIRERPAKIYAAWMRLWYPLVVVERE